MGAIGTIGELELADWLRLNGLLEQALELEPAARALWLESLAPEDAPLAPLLQRLLQGEAPTWDLRLAERLARSEPALTGAPGERLGPYGLIRVLGRGGMASVWLAERADGKFDRRVALKIPSAERSDRGLADRLRRECAVLASLNHPNVAHLYDAGWSQSGVPYLAMEVVEGQPIDRYCAARELDVRARVRLFVAVLRAVAYAHARLVVHRDLKPANVLVTDDGQVKLLDFGIAKILAEDGAAAGETDLTQLAGQPITLAYAAPEQVLGQPVTTATDIYTLGVMLFELLAGRRPFADRRGGRSAVQEVLDRGRAPAPSSVAANRTLSRLLRGDLDVIVGKALEHNPERRFETAAAFADDLERYLGGRSIRAQRGSAWHRALRFVARNRITVGAGATVAVALLAGLSVALWQAKRAQVQAQNAAAIGNFVLSVIQQADPNTSQETRASDLTLLHTIEDRIGKELGDRPDLRFELHLAIATAYQNRGDEPEAARMIRTALRDARQAPGVARLDQLRAQELLGEVTSDDAEGIQVLDSAIAGLREMGRPGVPVLVDALLARAMPDWRHNPAADAPGRVALELARSQLGEGDEHTLKAATALATMLGPGLQGRNDEALAVLEPVMRSVYAAATIAPGNPLLLEAQSKYGEILCSVGRCDEGIPLIDQSVRAAIGHHHDGRAVRAALMLLARGQIAANRYDGALSTLASMYSLLSVRAPYGSQRRYEVVRQLSIALTDSHRPLEAEPFQDEMAAYGRTLPAESRERIADVELFILYSRLATLLELGQYASAQRAGEAIVARSRAESRPYYEMIANVYLSDVYLAQGNLVQAERAAVSALDYLRRAASPHDDLRYQLSAVARVRLAQHRYAEALAVTDAARGQHFASDDGSPEVADYNLARGRALLALGRAAEARAPLAAAAQFWRGFRSTAPALRASEYWYGRALLATGDLAGGRALHAEGRPPDDFPPPDMQRLRADRSLPAQLRIAAVLKRYPLRPEVAELITRESGNLATR